MTAIITITIKNRGTIDVQVSGDRGLVVEDGYEAILHLASVVDQYQLKHAHEATCEACREGNVLERFVCRNGINDAVVNDVVQSLRERSMKGQQQYGSTLEANEMSMSEWLCHLREELQDAALYARKIERLLNETSSRAID